MKSKIKHSLVAAGGILLAAAVIMTVKLQGWVGDEAPERFVMVLAGLTLAWYGNLVPKTVAACSPSTRRIAGWTAVLAGLAFAAAWIFVPVEPAAIATVAIGAGAMILIASYCLWRRSSAA